MFGGKKAKELEEELLALQEKQNRLQEQISNISTDYALSILWISMLYGDTEEMWKATEKRLRSLTKTWAFC